MKTFILLIFAWQITHAQINLTKPEITIPFAFFAGACDGFSQMLYSHYEQFAVRFPNANDKYWNPGVSWANKYKAGDPLQGERFPGSTTVFVFTTDAYHLFRTINKINLVTLGALEFSARRKWMNYIIDFVLYSAVYSAGFTLTYDVIFR